MLSKSTIAPGRSIGKYEIVKHLATGGMAEIYLARVSTLPGLQKLVVLKRMLPDLAVRDDYVRMFLDEARIATMLDHPNIVHTFDAGVVDDKPFLAMEYLNGEPVSAVMSALSRRSERLAVEHALGVVIGVCAGLHYAHEKVGLDGRALNIVHRDVTPQNVIVTYDGGVKLVDFGIAKSAQRVGSTRYGTIKGKVPYMSPEQCMGEPLDRRSDVFSVGIMLYELTLSKRLFVGKGDYEVLKQIVEGRVPPPRELDPGFDPALENVLMRALEKAPARRQQSARELQGELEAVARAAALPVSSLTLAQLMERCFGSKIQVLRQAEAQGNVELLSLVLEGSLASEEFDQLPPSATAPAVARALPGRAPSTIELQSTVEVDEPLTRADAPARSSARARQYVAAVAVALAAGVTVAWLVAPVRPRFVTPPLAPSASTVAAPPTPPPPVAAPVAAPAPSVEPGHHPARLHRVHGPAAAAAGPSDGSRVYAAPSVVEHGTGRLVLASSPWCRVSIDGVDHGPTPLRVNLPAGSHVVELTNPDYHIARRLVVVVHADETVRKSLDFGD